MNTHNEKNIFDFDHAKLGEISLVYQAIQYLSSSEYLLTDTLSNCLGTLFDEVEVIDDTDIGVDAYLAAYAQYSPMEDLCIRQIAVQAAYLDDMYGNKELSDLKDIDLQMMNTIESLTRYLSDNVGRVLPAFLINDQAHEFWALLHRFFRTTSKNKSRTALYKSYLGFLRDTQRKLGTSKMSQETKDILSNEDSFSLFQYGFKSLERTTGESIAACYGLDDSVKVFALVVSWSAIYETLQGTDYTIELSFRK